jgi:glycine cleavage system transcriptional repressor
VSKRLAVALIGQDRPGIVASLTGWLLDAGCNLEDVATSILSGHFAIMLVASAPDDLDVDATRAALEAMGSSEAFTTAVWEIRGETTTDHPTHVITLYGRDRPGIVHAVAKLMAELGINICDMTCRLHHSDGELYVVNLEVHVPDGSQQDEVERQVAGVATRLEFDSSLRTIEQAEL